MLCELSSEVLLSAIYSLLEFLYPAIPNSFTFFPRTTVNVPHIIGSDLIPQWLHVSQTNFLDFFFDSMIKTSDSNYLRQFGYEISVPFGGGDIWKGASICAPYSHDMDQITSTMDK